MGARFRQLRRAIYALKRQYGQPIVLRRTTGDSTNASTGIQSDTVVEASVRYAVVLPAKMVRAFSYDLSFIAANKNFTYGGLYDHQQRIVLVSKRDVPSDFPIDINMSIVFKNLLYKVKDYQDFEDGEILALTIDGLKGGLPLAETSISVAQNVGITDRNVRS